MNTISKRKNSNIGVVIFLAILLYIVVHVFSFLVKSEISIYEVQPGELYTTVICDGMIIRQEELVHTEIAGYVNYYFSEGSRVAKNSTIYSIDSNRDIYDLLSGSASEIKLTGEDLADLKDLVQEQLVFTESFQNIQERKAKITQGYQRLIDITLMKELNQIVTSTGIISNFHVVTTEKSGIISYIVDDYTNYTIQDVTAACFQKKDTSQSLYSMDLITANSPVYKIIQDDSWKIVVLLDDNLYGQLIGKDSATFYINNEIKVTAPVTCYRKEENYFAEITMEKYLSNYTSTRFLTIKFELEDLNGLKIPETAITWKDYYRIPEDYLEYGGNSNEKGLLVEVYDAQTGTASPVFQKADIFYSSDGFVYIDCADFSKESYIINPHNTSERVMLYTFVNKLEGAFNVNKGYAVFKRIERIKTENGYAMIKKDTVAGLSAYDHIALDATKAVEGSVIY